MIYPVYVHLGDEQHAHGVTIPDFPGCFTAADTLDEIPRMVQEAVELYCEGEKLELPQPSSVEELKDDPAYQGGIWMLVDIDTTRLDTKPVRVNVSLPRGLVATMDEYAKTHGMTRSGLIATAVRRVLAEEKCEKDDRELGHVA